MTTTYDDITTSYSVLAKTERVQIITNKILDTKWQLKGADIQDYTSGKDTLQNFDGVIDVFDSVLIDFERVGFGDVGIVMQSLNNGPILTYSDKFDVIKKDTLSNPGGIYIYLKDVKKKSENGIHHIFPFTGKVTLGHTMDERSFDRPLVLRSGIINMRGKNKIENSYFLGDTEYLRIGDQLEFPKDTVSIGIIAINDEPNIDVNFRTEANEAYIKKPGMKSNNYKISVSRFDQWKNDKDFQRLSMAFAIIFVFTTIFTFIFDLHNYLKNN
jgi:hypothetical protein